MDTPGITVAPLEMLNGVVEFAEVWFDDVVVPADRVLGEVDGGWAVAMSILPYERSSCFWQRIAFLYRRLERVVEAAPDDERSAEVLGQAFVELHGLRARSRATQHRLARGETLGAETSIDKVLVATAEQTTYDAARRLLPRCRRARRHRRRRVVAQRVPVLPGRDHLRRHRRGAAQHHRPTAARARERRVMDAAERALLGVDGAQRARDRRPGGRRRHAGATSVGPRCSPPSRTTRWPSCSPSSARRGTATALDDVVLDALGVAPGPGLAAVLPRFGTWLPPGRVDAERCRRSASRPAAPPPPRPSCSCVGRDRPTPSRPCCVPRPTSAPVAGVDPDAAWHEVRIDRRRPGRPRGSTRAGAPCARRRAARDRAPDRRRVPHDARPRPHARAGPRAVRASDRTVPGGTPPAGRRARRDRDARRGARRRGRRAEPTSPPRWRRRRPAAPRDVVATNCQQVLAGIGFTTEHPFHRFLKRTMVLDGVFGTAEEIALDLGRHLLTTRRVPTLIEL